MTKSCTLTVLLVLTSNPSRPAPAFFLCTFHDPIFNLGQLEVTTLRPTKARRCTTGTAKVSLTSDALCRWGGDKKCICWQMVEVKFKYALLVCRHGDRGRLEYDVNDGEVRSLSKLLPVFYQERVAPVACPTLSRIEL